MNKRLINTGRLVAMALILALLLLSNLQDERADNRLRQSKHNERR